MQNEDQEQNSGLTDDEVVNAAVDSKIAMAGRLIDEATGMLQRAILLLGQSTGQHHSSAASAGFQEDDGEMRVIEGVFDGQRMIGPDGRHYSVPANYASKSKLVEGDLLKLTITPRGAFVFKQVGPIPRRRLLGVLTHANSGTEWVVKVGSDRYRVLTASVTYFRGKEADEVTILVPESGKSAWAAVENVIKNGVPEVRHDQTDQTFDSQFE